MSNTGDFDDLFTGPRTNTQSWFDKAPPEVQEWCRNLAKACIENKQEPNWALVVERLEEEVRSGNLPPSQVPAQATLRKHIRKLIKDHA